MTEQKRFTIKQQDDLFGVVDNYSADKVCVINGIRTEIEAKWLCENMNTLNDENKQLKQALKNSYINEICENCKYGHYWISETFGFGLEWEFECTKKHFGNDHWKCDGLTECDEFELEIKGDVK